MRLREVLAGLDAETLARLVAQTGRALGEGRGTPLDRAVRALAHAPALEATLRGSEPARDAASVLASSAAPLPRELVGAGALVLVARGLAFALPGDRLVMPGAYRVSVPPTRGEHPRAARLLLAALPDETVDLLAGHYFGHRAGPPRPLVLEETLLELESPKRLGGQLEVLAPAERRLLQRIEARGGEADTEELLELEGDPRRYVTARPSLPRKSASTALVARGLLLPIGAGRYALPREVDELVGRPRRAAAARVRAEIVERAAREDELPRRTRLGHDPGALAVAIAMRLAAEGVVSKDDAAEPKRAVERVAAELGVSAQVVVRRMSLFRAAYPRGADVPIADVGAALVRRWLDGGGYDEARVPRDVRRTPRLRGVKAIAGGMRDALVETLLAIHPKRFAPAVDVVRGVLADPRRGAVDRAMERARERSPEDVVADASALVAALLESAEDLGLVDVGQGPPGPLLRASRLLRDVVVGASSLARPTTPELETGLPVGVAPVDVPAAAALRRVLPGNARLRALLTVAPLVGVFAVEGALVVSLDAESLARVRPPTFELTAAEALERLVALLGPLPPALEALVVSSFESRPAVRWTRASAVLTVPEAVRAALLGHPHAGRLFVEGLGGDLLVVRDGISPNEVARIVRAVGGRFETESAAPERS